MPSPLARLRAFLAHPCLVVWQPELLYQARAVCKCGKPIHGCDHWLGVKSTWEHAGTLEHFHPDGSPVEHA
jgi:hypothetical protein